MHIVCFGEILLRLSPPEQFRFVQANNFAAVYGGSEANVAVSLAQFGLHSSYLTRVPDHELGQAALGAVARFGVRTDHAARGGERLGIYFLEQGAGRRASKVLYDRAGSGMATLTPGMIDWRAALENASWLHWSGITPALSASAAATVMEGLRVARELNLHISCDLNYRSNLWQYGAAPHTVMPDLVALTDVLLGDQTAFDICLGIRLPDDAPPEQWLTAAQAAFPRLRHVAMTRREGFSASHNTYQGILRSGDAVYFSQKHDMPDMLDRIGGGDAFMAGLIYGLKKMGESPQESIEFASAAAALKHYVAGDFNLCTKEEVMALVNGQSGGRVKR
jgi:2-dehydro-3-deoxygluconokinase